MPARLFLIVWLVLLVFAQAVLAGGSYQLTKDGTTYVWNNYPRPGDEVSWSGGKDSEGYATGEGVLTWFKRGIFMTRYSGRMNKGKLDGPVTNEDASGKKFRGTFINGVKSGDWAMASDAPAIPAYAEGESLRDFLNRRDAEITGAYRACLAAFRGHGQEKLRIAQRAWIVFSNKNEAAAELAGTRRGLNRDELIREAASEVGARTEQLRKFFNLPNQDVAACQRDWDAAERDLTVVYNQVLGTLAPDEQQRVRDAQRAWIEFREKSAASHDADTTGRASVWNRVVIDQRRTEELRDFYLNRLVGRVPAAAPAISEATPGPSSLPSAERRFSQLTPNTSGTIAPGPSPAVGVSPLRTASPSGGPVRAKIISDFKADIKALFGNVSGSGAFKPYQNLKEVTPLPAPLSEAVTKEAEKAREFRSRIGFADALRECESETALIDALVAYDQSLRSISSSDGPTAQAAIAACLRDYPDSPAAEYKILWETLNALKTVFEQATQEASRHLDEAQRLVGADKTAEAIKEYEKAHAIFPDPKVVRTVKRLKEESLGL